MARLARLVIPGLPHHVTQRGNRRHQTFFDDGDYAAYVELMAQWCREEAVEIWAYCLMPNHVHLIAVPTTVVGVRSARRIGAIRDASTSARSGEVIFGKGASRRSSWTSPTCWQRRGTWSGIRCGRAWSAALRIGVGAVPKLISTAATTAC